MKTLWESLLDSDKNVKSKIEKLSELKQIADIILKHLDFKFPKYRKLSDGTFIFSTGIVNKSITELVPRTTLRLIYDDLKKSEYVKSISDFEPSRFLRFDCIYNIITKLSYSIDFEISIDTDGTMVKYIILEVHDQDFADVIKSMIKK